MLEQINELLKAAMKAKDAVRLRSLRLIKSSLMLLHTGGNDTVSQEDEMAVLIKMAKQRKDSIEMGDNVSLVSRFHSNPVGLMNPCVLDTLMGGGKIVIGNKFGMACPG